MSVVKQYDLKLWKDTIDIQICIINVLKKRNSLNYQEVSEQIIFIICFHFCSQNFKEFIHYNMLLILTIDLI